MILAYFSLPIDKQLAMVTGGYGKAGYTAVGQLVVVIANLNMFGIHVYIIEKTTATAYIMASTVSTMSISTML